MLLRGAPEGLDVVNAPLYRASLFDLLTAYARQRQKQALSHVRCKTRRSGRWPRRARRWSASSAWRWNGPRSTII